MQSLDQEENEEEKQQKVGDEKHPFSPPDDVLSRIEKFHQMLDDGLDAHQVYDEGLKNAAGADFPKKSAVLSYKPPKKGGAYKTR